MLISTFVSDEYQWLHITILSGASLLDVQLIRNIQYVLVLILNIITDAFYNEKNLAERLESLIAYPKVTNAVLGWFNPGIYTTQ